MFLGVLRIFLVAHTMCTRISEYIIINTLSQRSYDVFKDMNPQKLDG